VHTEDISAVKYLILQHLPVLLQDTMEGHTDSQATTSIYVDNYALELYRGRLEKSPGAIAIRFRWYGSEPGLVFVERKTHRESWTGQLSVKERFAIREDQVLPLLHGRFDVEAEIAKLRSKGKSEADIADWRTLATEIIQAINSKQLVPTMRTAYMRTAFQIANDATVRISLDTNLTMICERTKETLSGARWYRDPTQRVANEEVTRFPHGVLEVKLQVEDESQTPAWVTELIQSGKLLEVSKFSKFIHGCAVLMPQDVYAVPYWIDDVTLKDSIVKSGGGQLLAQSAAGSKGAGVNPHYSQLLPHDQFGNVRATYYNTAPASSQQTSTTTNATSSLQPLAIAPAGGETDEAGVSRQPFAFSGSSGNKKTNKSILSSGYLVKKASTKRQSGSLKQSLIGASADDSYKLYEDNDDVESNKGHSPQPATTSSCCEVLFGDCYQMLQESWLEWTGSAAASHINQQKVEPKLFFANERTFVSWLQMSVIMTSLSVTISALGDGQCKLPANYSASFR
jgi:hypothetical protein